LPKRAIVFSGIGNPQRLIFSLQDQGIEVVSHRFFSDHYNYSSKTIEELCRWKACFSGLPVLTTLKDYVKLGAWVNADFNPMWLSLDLEFEKSDQFWKKINSLVKS
jgi:tetraacyldisaccharide-1-P 4'-kinase